MATEKEIEEAYNIIGIDANSSNQQVIEAAEEKRQALLSAMDKIKATHEKVKISEKITKLKQSFKVVADNRGIENKLEAHTRQNNPVVKPIDKSPAAHSQPNPVKRQESFDVSKDYYKMLGMNRSTQLSPQEIQNQQNEIRSCSGNFKNITLNQVNEYLRASNVINTPSRREEYDKFLDSQNKENVNSQNKENNTTSEKPRFPIVAAIRKRMGMKVLYSTNSGTTPNNKQKDTTTKGR